MRRLSILLACVAMALTLIAIIIVPGASAASKPQYYGALYIGDVSQTESKLYWKTRTSKASATQAALNTCQQKGATDCQLVVWVYNGWTAFAEGQSPGPGSPSGASWDRTEQGAAKAALTACQQDATGCKLVGTWLTAFDPKKKTTGGFK
jgi:hypothetical protein